MSELTIPWVEVSDGSSWKLQSCNLNGAENFHALFVARIEIKPFAYLENLKWGFSSESMLQGAMARQRLFVEAQQLVDDLADSEPLNRRTFALRCLRDPSTTELQMVILGKVSAANSDAACSGALEYWQEINSIFPYDYVLVPARTKDDFIVFSGQSILDKDLSCLSVAEISRFEGVLANTSASLYLLGRWGTTSTANEQIWRALAGCNTPVLLNIIFRPTILFDYETMGITEMAKTAQTIFDDKSFPNIQREAQWINNAYNTRLNQLRYPFLTQIHLIGQGGIPEYLPRVIGSALVQTNENLPIEPRYQIKKISNKDSVQSLIRDVRWLELSLSQTIADSRFARMHYLVDTNEADTLFRLPFPPKTGIPNVSFAIAKTV